MPEEQDNQIERRDPGGISRRSETARRGSDAARFVGGLANRRLEDGAPSTVSVDFKYEFWFAWDEDHSASGTRPMLSLGLNRAGNVYAADSSNNEILVFNRNGQFLFKWGATGNQDGHFNNPRDLSISSDGNLYVVDSYNGRIQVFDHKGRFLFKWGGHHPQEFSFEVPLCVRLDREDRVYILDALGDRIQVFDKNGNFLFRWGGDLYGVYSFDINNLGEIYVPDSIEGKIQVYDPLGGFIKTLIDFPIEGVTSTNASDNTFLQPVLLALDGWGNVHVSYEDVYRIDVFNRSGELITTVGESISDAAEFLPEQFVVAPTGHLYVVDSSSNEIKVFKRVPSGA